MNKRGSNKIKKLILKSLDKKGDLTFAQLERKVNTGFRTIKANCEELRDFGSIKIARKLAHKANGRAYFVISITSNGKDVLKRL